MIIGWHFKKHVYVSLLAHIEEVLSLNAVVSGCLLKHSPIPEDNSERLYAAIKRLSISANLAPLAASDSILPLVKSGLSKLDGLGDLHVPFTAGTLSLVSQVFIDLRARVQEAGRKDLWGTAEPEAKTEQGAEA